MGTHAYVFRYNRRFVNVALPLAALALAVGFYLTYAEWPDGPDLAQGALIVVFAVALLVWIARTWSDRSVIVSVSSDGIYDRRLSDAPIPWDAITAIRTYDVWDSRLLRWLGSAGGVRSGASNRFAGLIVENSESHFRPSNPLVRALTRFTCWLTGYPLLSINMSPLDGTHADLLAAVRRYAGGDRIRIEE